MKTIAWIFFFAFAIPSIAQMEFAEQPVQSVQKIMPLTQKAEVGIKPFIPPLLLIVGTALLIAGERMPGRDPLAVDITSKRPFGAPPSQKVKAPLVLSGIGMIALSFFWTVPEN